MASHLERELSNLKQELVGLGTMVENSVRKVILAKEKNDQDLAKSIILKDKEIHQREIEIEEECLKLLALYQPVAVDLRLMVSILKINENLEQIGDLAKEISRRFISPIENQKIPQFNYSDLSEKVQWMVRKCLEAIVEMDIELAKEICRVEDEVDSISLELTQSIIQEIQSHPEWTNTLINEVFICESLEQMADHAKKIAEDVIYTVNAEIVRHQSI